MAVEIVAALCGAFFIMGAILVNLYCPLRESGKGAGTGVVFMMLLGTVFCAIGAASWAEGGLVTIIGGVLRLVFGIYGFQAVRKRNLPMLSRYSRLSPHLVWMAALFDIASIFLYVQYFGAIDAKQWHRTTEDTFVATAIIGGATDLIAIGWSGLCSREVLNEVERETFWMK